jgi:hypothetical protein
MENEYSDLIGLYQTLIDMKPVCYDQIPLTINNVAIFHIFRAMHLLMGIKVLCFQSLVVEAQILLRTLLNLYVNIKWINYEDTDNRIQRFVDFDKIFRYKELLIAEAHSKYDDPDLKALKLSPRFKENTAQVQKIMQKYKISDCTKITSWTPKKIWKMAEEVGLHWEYDVRYTGLSTLEHTNPAALTEYLSNGRLEFEQDTFKIPVIMLESFQIYLSIMETIIKMINGPFTESSYARLRMDNLSYKYVNPLIKHIMSRPIS